MIKVGDKRFCLTLIDKVGTQKITHFICRCDCGREKKISRAKFGITKSCGCRRTTLGDNHFRWTGCSGIQGSIWCQYVRNANVRNIPFKISIQDGWNIFEKQNHKCAISGVEIKFGKRRNKNKVETTASLDRIDNSKGYLLNNVHWVHKKINQIKMDMSLLEFLNWCKIVTLNHTIYN